MSDLVGNPEDRFSHKAALLHQFLCISGIVVPPTISLIIQGYLIPVQHVQEYMTKCHTCLTGFVIYTFMKGRGGDGRGGILFS